MADESREAGAAGCVAASFATSSPSIQRPRRRDAGGQSHRARRHRHRDDQRRFACRWTSSAPSSAASSNPSASRIPTSNTGDVLQFSLVTEKYITLLSAVTPEYFLLLVLRPDGNYGRARHELAQGEICCFATSWSEVAEFELQRDSRAHRQSCRPRHRRRGDRTGRPEAAHRRQAAPQPQVIHSYAGDAARGRTLRRRRLLPRRRRLPKKRPRRRPEEDAAEAGLHIITSPIVGTFYRSANPGVRPVRQRRRPHLERAGALHHRGDEADERDRVGRRRRRHAHLPAERTADRVRREALRREAV